MEKQMLRVNFMRFQKRQMLRAGGMTWSVKAIAKQEGLSSNSQCHRKPRLCVSITTTLEGRNVWIRRVHWQRAKPKW